MTKQQLLTMLPRAKEIAREYAEKLTVFETDKGAAVLGIPGYPRVLIGSQQAQLNMGFTRWAPAPVEVAGSAATVNADAVQAGLASGAVSIAELEAVLAKARGTASPKPVTK